MTSGKILDSAVTASSYYIPRSLVPWRARLYGAGIVQVWGTSAPSDVNQWLQIDLGHATFVSGVATQGRDRSAQRVTSYMVKYSKGANSWSDFQENGIAKVGNIRRAEISIKFTKSRYFLVINPT